MSPAPEPSTPATAVVRVALVDADHRVRSCLRELIEVGGGVDVVAAVGHARGAVEAIERAAPHVVVVDPRLPDIDAGLALIAHIRAVAPSVRVLVMGWSDALEQADLGSVADGTLDKNAQPDDLIATIVETGRRVIA